MERRADLVQNLFEWSEAIELFVEENAFEAGPRHGLDAPVGNRFATAAPNDQLRVRPDGAKPVLLKIRLDEIHQPVHVAHPRCGYLLIGLSQRPEQAQVADRGKV